MNWKRQGVAVVTGVELADGRHGNVVLVGPRSNPKGAAVVLAGERTDAVETLSIEHAAPLLPPRAVVDILCMQERVFGGTAVLGPPEGLSG